jgi:hypothetical protein
VFSNHLYKLWLSIVVEVDTDQCLAVAWFLLATDYLLGHVVSGLLGKGAIPFYPSVSLL